MLSGLLQFWGGFFYLLNKVFLSRAERSVGEKEKKWRVACWVVYLIGLPAWVAIFVMNRNWIAAAIEAGGAPAMVLGVVIALHGVEREPKWLDWVARVAVLIGVGYSLYDFGGITRVNQILELMMSLGFLFGVYLLAKRRKSRRWGYLCFILMNGSNATLMAIQGYPWLFIQQLISIPFVVDAYRMSRKRLRH